MFLFVFIFLRDALLTGEGHLDGLLEPVWLSGLRGVSWKDTGGDLPFFLSEGEHEKHRFRSWCGFCLCLLTLSIPECR